MIRIWPNKSHEAHGNIRLKGDNKKPSRKLPNVFSTDELTSSTLGPTKSTLTSFTKTTTSVTNSSSTSGSQHTTTPITSSNSIVSSEDASMTSGATTVQPTTSSSSTRSSRYMKGGSLDSRYSTSVASNQRYGFHQRFEYHPNKYTLIIIFNILITV